MTTINHAYTNALLADASYVVGLRPGMSGTALEDALSPRMTRAQGEYIGANFEVVTLVETRSGSSFDAIVWKRKADNQVFVSLRGTQDLTDWLVDADLAVSGAARAQVADMVNWWLRITTAASQVAPQIQVIAPSLGPDGQFQYFGFREAAFGTGLLTRTINLELNGHSLGGHLATAFARIFGGTTVINHISTFNSAGFRPSSEGIFRNLQDMLGTGMASYPTAAQQSNYFAKNGLNFVTNSFWFNQVGQRVEVFNERGSGLENHYIYRLTDALALADALGKLDASLAMASFDAILEAASNTPGASLESALDAARRLFAGAGVSTTQIGDAFGSAPSRLDYHDKLKALVDVQAFQAAVGSLTVSNLANTPAAELSVRAKAANGLPYRYALSVLNPFAVLGPDSLYSMLHNTDGRLDLHSLVSGAGSISRQWITDRAAILGWKIERNKKDNLGLVVSSALSGAAVFVDKPSDPIGGDTIQVVNATQARTGATGLALSTAPRYVFGGDQTDDLSGGTNADHLFGEGGDDTLTGAIGNDYLEGGRGNDTYVYQSGDGFDTVLDVDGAGRMLFDGIELQSGERVGPYQWRFTSDFGREFSYWLRNETDGSRTLTITALDTPGSIQIRGYQDGALGIELPDFTPDSRPAVEMEAGTEGNDTLLHPFKPVKLGFAGEDILYGKPDFWLEGGVGNDWLPYAYSIGDAARGFTAFGGEGDDFAFGSVYDDELRAEDVAEFDALVEGVNSPDSGPEREVLFGAAGDDSVAGGRGNDWIAGGLGSDVLYGGAGNDILSGAGEIFMGDEVGQPGLDPQTQTFFNVHTSGWFDQSLIVLNLPSRISDYSFTPDVLGTVARDGLDESGWGDGADSIFAGAGNDEAWGGFGDDNLAGEAGDDTLMGESGNDLLDGGAGDDRLFGGEGNDVLIGGAGADVLEGGAGDDIYQVDASDTVRDTQGRNRIRFGAEVRRETMHASQTGTTLVLTGVAGGTVTIENGLAGAVSDLDVEYISFSFGEFLSSITADALDVQGSDADEAVFGASGNDRIAAGRGSDVVEGGAGDDVYVFNPGDGFDVLTELEGVNVVEFGPGIDAADVTANVLFNFSNGGYDMYVGYGPGDTVAIVNGPVGMIAEYRFADGTVLSHGDVIERDIQGFTLAGTEGNDSLFGGGGNDSLSGAAGDDTLRGRGGNDSLSGNQGNDVLDGGEGNDRLFGDVGNDVLTGGEGNDFLDGESGDDLLVGGAGADSLQGGEGNDTYMVDAGDGADMLDDTAGANTIRFGTGITPDSLAASILNATDGGIYLSLQYGASDYLLVKQDPARPGASTATFSFASGEAFTQGELMARTLSAPLDYVGGQNAILIYGSRFDDRVLGSPQDDFMDAGAGNDLLQGEDGVDVLVGGEGDDLLLGGTGDDALTGGTGGDTYALRRGMGRDIVTEDPADAGINTLRLGADMGFVDLAADRQGDDLYLHVKNTRDGVVIADYFAGANGDAWQVESAGGTITPLADVLANLEQTVRAASVAAAYGQFEDRARAAYASGLYAAGYKLGSDRRFHAETTFNGTFFSSHHVRDVGFSVVAQSEDSLSLSRGSAPLAPTGQTFSASQTARTIQVLNTANSRVMPVPDGGNAYQPGAQPAAVLDVNALLVSGVGGILLPDNVVPIYDGQVVTRQFSANPAPESRIAALATYTGGAVPVYATQTITHTHHESSDSWQMQIAEITGGDSDNMIDGGPGFSLVDGGAGNDLIWANGSNSLPGGSLSSDGIPGALLYGNAGDDELNGTDFDDVLIGGSGNDEMRGGAGNDTYLLFSGDGNDLIVEDGETTAGAPRQNVLELPDGVTMADLTASYEERVERSRYRLPTDAGSLQFTSMPVLSVHNTLLVSWNGGSVRIVLPHAEQNAGTGIDLLRFSDGSSATLVDVFALAGGTPGVDPHNRDNDEVGISYGGGGNDTLQGTGVIGGAGRDTLIGSTFDDDLYGGELVEEIGLSNFTGGAVTLSTLWDEGNVYRGGAGNDVLFATAGSDVFEYELGDGEDTVTDMLHDETFIYGYGGPIGSAQHFLPHWQDPTAVDPAHQILLFSSSDTLKFGLEIAPHDVQFYRRRFENNEDLLLATGAGSVRLENWFKAQLNQLSRIEFADGTIWDAGAIAAGAASARLLVRGSEFDDFLFGGPDNEAFQGGEGNDTYLIGVGGGSDSIVDSGGADTLSLGVNIEEISLGLGSLEIRVGLGGDSVHLENFDPKDVLAGTDIEFFQFADGTQLAYADLVARGFDLVGTDGDDAINGTNLVDRIDGGAGDDTLAGGPGSDTYRFGPGSARDLIRETASVADSDTLQVLANPGDVAVTREGDIIVVSLEGDTDRAAIEWFRDPNARVENVTFLDGTVWDAATLEAQIQSETNQTPTVANPVVDQEALEDAPFSFTVPADAFSDPDAGDTLAYTAENLPAWLSFDPATRTLSGAPLNADVGSHPIRAVVTDGGGLSTFDEFVVNVVNVNDAPSLAIPVQQQLFDAGTPFTFSLPAGTFVDDDAGDTLSLSATLFGGGALPAWLAFDPASRAFSGSPQTANIGISHVAVTATDAAGESTTTDFGLIVRTAAGATAGGRAGDDSLYGNAGDETLKAKGGNDYLYGDAGDDLLRGGAGSDVLQGGEGEDVLRGGTGQNVLDGGAGDDVIHGGQGSGFLAGGAGNDIVHVGRGHDVIAFNLGDGIDTMYGGRDGGNTLSFGGGIGYDDLSFSKDGKDLVVNVGAADRVVLKNWYHGNRSVLTLQLVHDASDEFDATSSDPLYNRKVQTFDFLGLVSAFDAARAASPGLTSWELTNALLQFHLSGADDLALGGDLAYWHGKNRGLNGISLQAAQQVIGTPGFGSDAQTLRPFSGLQEGFAKLA